MKGGYRKGKGIDMGSVDLSIKLGSLQLKNPVMTASGTCGFGEELAEYFDIEKLGALTVKGLTIEPCSGNPTPRIAETAAGMLNSIGLENPGLNEFINTKMDVIEKFKFPVFVNISGHALDDFAYMAEKLAAFPEIAGIEVNVSCPNLAGGGMAFGTDSELVYRVTERVNANYPGMVIVKLAPNVTDIVEIAKAAESAGADAVSLINTLLGMAIDVDKQQPVLGNVFGGLSGPAVKPVALRMVYQVAGEVRIPVIGMGGIMTGEDAVEFLLAGARAVAIGTATLVRPDAGPVIIEQIKEYMQKHGINRLADIIGKANPDYVR